MEDDKKEETKKITTMSLKDQFLMNDIEKYKSQIVDLC